MRWFKGACKEMPVESISTCITLSSTLRSNIVHNTPIEAFASFEIDLYKVRLFSISQVNKLIRNSFYIFSLNVIILLFISSVSGCKIIICH